MKDIAKTHFALHADFFAWCAIARHPVNGVVYYEFLKPIRQRLKLMAQRKNSNRFYKV